MRIFFAVLCVGMLVLTATNADGGQGARGRAPQPAAAKARAPQVAQNKAAPSARIPARSPADLNRDGKVSAAERGRVEHLRSVAAQPTGVASRSAARTEDERQLGSSTRVAALRGRTRDSKRD